MANRADPDQFVGAEQSDLGLQCLPWPVCPSTWDHNSAHTFSISV